MKKNTNGTATPIVAKSANTVKHGHTSTMRIKSDDLKLLQRIELRARLADKLERDVTPADKLAAEQSDYLDMVLSASTRIDSADAVTELTYAVVYSVLKRVIDPRGGIDGSHRSDDWTAVDDSGHADYLIRARRDLAIGRAYLDALRAAANKAYRLEVCSAGDRLGKYRVVVADHAALADLNKLIQQTLPDVLEYVQTVALALYDLAECACDRLGVDSVETSPAERRAELVRKNPLWILDSYIVRELDKRVYIRLSDSAVHRDRETTALIELYRVVRRYIRNNRAARADISGYTYIALDDIADNGDTAAALDGVLYRAGRYADIGGYASDSMALYTHDGKDAIRASIARERLERELSPQQRDILRLRLKGYGKKAIATYFGVRDGNILNQINRIRDKARAIGIMPDGITLDAIDD